MKLNPKPKWVGEKSEMRMEEKGERKNKIKNNNNKNKKLSQVGKTNGNGTQDVKFLLGRQFKIN